MSQIDISQWKEFKVIKLFNVELTDGDNQPKKMIEGDIPLISATADNNGIIGYYTSDTRIFPRNTITVDMFGHAFVQSKKYQTVSHGRVNVFSPKKTNLSFNSLLFIASVINKVTKQHDYGYKTMLTRSKSSKLIIKLPVDSNGDPDWQYMDTYIAKLTALAHKNVSSLKEAKAKPAKLNIDHWGEFKISDWFDIRPSKYTKKNGKVLKNAELFDGGNNPVIVNSNTNNGIGGYTSKPLTEQGNVITYSDTTDGASTIFYQDKPFVGYSHVKVMLPKLKLSQATMIYLTSIIISAIKNQKYDFSYKLTTDKMLNTIIKLPIDAESEPDWEYMDNQVCHLAALSNLTITSLRSVI